MKNIIKNGLITVGLALLVVSTAFYFNDKHQLLLDNDDLALADKPYFIEKLEYVDTFIVPDITSADQFDTLLATQPTAAVTNVQDIADAITQEVNNSFNPDINHSLPILAHWNTGDIGVDEGMTPDYVITLIEEGKHILPSWRLEPYWATQLPDTYYQASILRAKELNLPLTFIINPIEKTFVDDAYYSSLPLDENPNVIDNNLNIVNKISPLGPNSLWDEVAVNSATNPLLQKIQEWYPNPPLIMFVDNTDSNKLSWTELNTSKRYLDNYSNDKSDIFKRTLIGAQWIEKYRVLHEAFKNALVFDTWKNNTKFISNNTLTLDIGSSETWHYNSTITNHYFSAWPQATNATNVEYATDGTAASLNKIIFDANNLDFLLNEAKKSNQNYNFQISIAENNAFSTQTEYRGFAQLSLWLNRPSVLRELISVSNDRTIILPRYQAVIDSVELIHNETTLQRFWKDGKLVENNNKKIEQSLNVPDIYIDESKWFLLDVDTNPVAPWTTSSVIPVYAIALKTGVAPNREWLVYAQSPKGDLTNITVTIPEYMDVTINSSIQGDFFNIKENQDPGIFKIESFEDNVPDTFSFADATDAMRYTLIESNTTTISGINVPTTISISKGSYYRINSGLYTDYNGTIRNGDSVQVRHVSSADFSTSVSTTVTIGGVDATFTSRTLDENLRVVGLVNVMDPVYGVVADGFTDDSAAIIQAFNVAKAEGKNLYFPDGVYQCDLLMSMQGVRLIGQSKAGTIIKGLDDVHHSFDGAENITFQDYKIVDYAAATSRVFRNCKFLITTPTTGSYYMMTAGYSPTRQAVNEEFTDCDFVFSTIYIGLHIINYNNVVIRNCTFTGNASHNIRLGDAYSKNSNISITGNTVDGGKTGIFIGSNRTSAIEGGLIEGNTVRNQYEEGISLDGFGNNAGLVPVIANGPIASVSNDENGRLVIGMDHMVMYDSNSIDLTVPSPISLRDDWTNFYFSFGEGSGLEGTVVKIHSFDSVANTVTLDSVTSAINIHVGGDAGVQAGFFNWIIRGNTVSGVMGGADNTYGTAISLWLNVFGTLVEDNTVTDSAHGLVVAGGLSLSTYRTLAYGNVIRNNTLLNCDQYAIGSPSTNVGAVIFSTPYGGSVQYNNQFINNTVDGGRMYIEQQEKFLFEGNTLSMVPVIVP